MKKIISLVLALAMVLGVTSAFAASITLNSTAEDAQANATQYTYYEIMKADLSGLSASDYGTNGAPNANAPVVYYVTKSALATALGNLKVKDTENPIFRVTQVGTSNRWNVELVATSISGLALAEALNVDAVKNNAEANGTFTMDAASKTATKSGLEAGYYMVLASNGTALVAQTLSDVTINEKNDYPDVDKKITGENGTALSEPVTANDVNIGDTVTYTVPVDIPTTVAEKVIVVHDKMFKGLTLDASSLANDKSVTGLSIVAETVENPDTNYNYYKIEIPAATVVSLAGQTITFTYTATLNAQAVINGDNPNTVKLTYDNYTTHDHTVITKTHKVEVDKKDANNQKLAGVKFTLTRDNNGTTEYYVTKSGDSSVWTTTVTEFETTTTGNIVFDGVDAGTYTLTETFTPAGFNPLTAPIEVVVAADGTVTYTSTDPHNTASGATATDAMIPVINQQGTTLPSTGGIGTTIFYILGGLLVVGAAVILVARRKAQD